MNVKQLATLVNKNLEVKYGNVLPVYKLEYAIASAFNIITETVAAGESVTVKDFGKFLAIDAKERVIVNELTKLRPEGSVTVPAHRSPKFRAARAYQSKLRYSNQVETEVAA